MSLDQEIKKHIDKSISSLKNQLDLRFNKINFWPLIILNILIILIAAGTGLLHFKQRSDSKRIIKMQSELKEEVAHQKRLIEVVAGKWIIDTESCSERTVDVGYDTAMTYIANYDYAISIGHDVAEEARSAGITEENSFFYNSEDYPRGDNLDLCYVYGINTGIGKYVGVDRLENFGGVEIRYGLKERTELTVASDLRSHLDAQRVGIVLPSKEDGSAYRRDELRHVRIVVVERLPPLYHDPCPPLCDY